jgi:DNA-binding transcriptional ArsR family regulator
MPTTRTDDDARLDETFAALASTTRQAILAHLALGAATVGELAEPFEFSLPTISKHLKVLERAGLVRRGRHAQYRPCELDPAPLREVAAWADEQRTTWEASFDRLERRFASLQAQQEGDSRSPNRATRRAPS